MASDDGTARWPGRRTRRRLALGIGLGLGCALLVLALRPTAPLRVAEAQTFDLRTRWLADPASADSSIVIIAIDDNSIEVYRDLLGRWPWPREAYGALLEYATAGGARVAAFDLLLAEPDLAAPLSDTLFAEALDLAGPGVLAFSLTPGDPDAAAEWLANRRADAMARHGEEAGAALMAARAAVLDKASIDVDGGAGRPDWLRDFAYAEPTHPLFAGAAAGLGVITFTPDPDGVSRRERLVFGHDSRVIPSLPLAAARVLDPERFGGTVRLEEDALIAGRERIPLDDGRMVIRWRGPYLSGGRTAYRVIPAYHVLQSSVAVRTGQEPPVALEEFRDKAVFIAATGIGAFESRATPLASNDPGIIIHATILDNLLNGDWLVRAPALASVALVLVTALAAGLAAVLGSVPLGTALALLALTLSGALSTLALARGVWIDMAAPLFAGALAFAGTMVGNYLTEGRDKRRVKDLFGRYVSPEYVRRLADDFENLRLGGERLPVTLLFSDIRGFTSLSEKLPAETVIEMLNEYLEKMAEVVFRHGGTLDKFIGDAVMAFWGAPVPTPDHARRAADAALDMLRELDRLNERWAAGGAPAQLRIGIGLNTGEAIVGNIGSLTRKLDYTAIGDTVNLASRLEGLNKEYGTTIIIGEGTRAALPDDYDLRPIDSVQVKGKEKPVQIYELRGRKAAGSRTLVAAGALALALVLAAPALASAQEGTPAKMRWTDWVYRPGAWQGAQVAELVTRDPATDSLALVGRVDLFAMAPRWRAEVRRVLPGDSMGPPIVLVFDGANGVVLTPLGSTPLAQHEAGNDPVVQAVVATVNAGRPQPPPPARIPRLAENGTVRMVILRKRAARMDFDERLLSAGAAGRAGRSLLRLGMHALGGERDQEVVASAGARGVATVQTAAGEITVMPDTAAILRMQRVAVGIITLDRFLREAGIRAPAAPAGGTPDGEAKEEEGA